MIVDAGKTENLNASREFWCGGKGNPRDLKAEGFE